MKALLKKRPPNIKDKSKRKVINNSLSTKKKKKILNTKEKNVYPTKEVNIKEKENSNERRDIIEEQNNNEKTDTIEVSNTEVEQLPTNIQEIEEPKTFKELGQCPAQIECVEKLNWKTPTSIQQLVLPRALEGKDIIGIAETGSGKTAAFVLPILQALLLEPSKLFGLILTPTRELAYQIENQTRQIGESIDIHVISILGGLDEIVQARELAKKPHIIVATPGRILYHLENTKGFNLNTLKYLVLDEADRLLSMDFEKDIIKILQIIPKIRRTYLFSATISSRIDKLQRIALIDPISIKVSHTRKIVTNLIQYYVFCPLKHKDYYLFYLLQQVSKKMIIIFVSTCNIAQKLSYAFKHLQYDVTVLHGHMRQESRLVALEKFRIGKKNILIATDVASRGLDIPNVDIVINYDIPISSKDYIHRVGRTARAGKSGNSITMITQYDIELIQRIEKDINEQLKEYSVQKEKVLMLQDQVNEALRLATMEFNEKKHKRRKYR